MLIVNAGALVRSSLRPLTRYRSLRRVTAGWEGPMWQESNGEENSAPRYEDVRLPLAPVDGRARPEPPEEKAPPGVWGTGPLPAGALGRDAEEQQPVSVGCFPARAVLVRRPSGIQRRRQRSPEVTRETTPRGYRDDRGT
ncbi:hypothetical protein AAFF_G00166740 [Aldrovandia affinis]|uniref:Uncharacterized protein n=1 Tax=Aldrovandia affinis TaxID=143900 RepID=A0AAD7RME0_9TELE|nr:hypothetical protein AAFF_G00166740 [Aldrovandia affinis]